MTIDRRLRSASNALREVELAVPDRVPRGSAARTPTLALPVLMLVFGAALAMTGLDRTPGSEPIPESATVVESSATLDDGDAATDDAADSVAATPSGASYDIDGELRLIRELRRRAPSGADGPATITATAPDANAERALINAIVERPAGAADVESPPRDAETGRPIVGLI